MSSVVLRIKRKASTEPVEGLVVALKKSKFDEPSDTNEVIFKFAATLKSETESVGDHIQAALTKEKHQRFSKWRNPKCAAISERNVHNIFEKLKKENKAAIDKKKLDLLNNRRLILSETVPILEKENIDSSSENSEVRKLFQLYDIIEETEDVKKQVEEAENSITCNDKPLVREESEDFVYDVYVSNVEMDDSFAENSICVRPYSMTADDIYSGDDSDECYEEDEDDSNDENNWRNDYPEDESSNEDSDKSEEYDLSAPDFIPNLHDDDEEGFGYHRNRRELEDEDLDYSADSDDELENEKGCESRILMELSDLEEND